MRKFMFVVLAVLLALSTAILTADAGVMAYDSTTRNYGALTLWNWGKTNFSDVWDLTRGDLVLSYTLDMSCIASPGWSIVEVGIREVGAGNIDPNYKGGWMFSRYAYNYPDDNTRDNDDYNVLMKHGWLDEYYDREGAFPGTSMPPITVYSKTNHGFWFDRDGVDPWQATYWGYIDGSTYNTGGIYNIQIKYRALDDTQGVMYATINGVEQGFYMSGWKNEPPEKMPVGRIFTGDMKRIQVFAGRGGGGGTVNLSGITVTGWLANQSPVIESLAATPDILWPPNNKPVQVDLAVGATDPNGADDIVKTTYAVSDEYGLYNVTETDLPADGIISLIAQRDGKDKDGRLYTITVKVYDAGGLSDSKTVTITVPHDQSNK